MTTAAVGNSIIVGVISDTHGLLRPEAAAVLAGCKRIIHAGDLGKPEIFEALSRIAPTDAVRGNVDCGAWALAFPETLTIRIDSVAIHVLHDLQTLAIDPAAAKVRVVISGHSHRPAITARGDVLYLNPGRAGPRRFSLPVTLARLEISPAGVRAELVDVLSRTALPV